MSIYEFCLFFIFIVKLFVLFFFLQNKFYPTETSETHLQFTENIFTVLMSLLILFLFHPFTQNPILIDRETKLFLTVFAVLTLVNTLA